MGTSQHTEVIISLIQISIEYSLQWGPVDTHLEFLKEVEDGIKLKAR